MKIAVDAWNLVDDRRGMGRYVRRVLADWASAGDLDVTLIARKDTQARELSEQTSWAVHTGSNLTADVVWYPWNAMRFEVANAQSVVLFHDAFAFTEPHREWIARQREQRPIRRAIESATALSTNSHWSAAELARVFRRDRNEFTVIHPVPDPFWIPSSSGPSDPYILVVSGSEERKNLPTLIRAFARAFPSREVELRIAGAMSAGDEWVLERSSIRYSRSRPTDEELRTLYSDALAVAVPSKAEGYGLMAVEAMACGAPVIASNAGALGEACDGAAMLVPPLDVEAWAFTLERVASDAVLRETLREQSVARAARIDRGEPARATRALLQLTLSARR